MDLRRPPRRNLALVNAQHFCLGEHVARLESRIFFEELFARTRRIEQAGAAVRVRSLQSNGLQRLQVTIA